MCFRVAMISLHTSPLAPLGRTLDAGGMNVYIRELARELGREGMYVDIFTRRSQAEAPMIQRIGERIRLISLTAGPVAPLPPNELFPYVGEFTRRLARFAQEDEEARSGYQLLHTHYWLSAAAALPLATAWDVPHVTMFHTVERLKAQQGLTNAATATAPLTPAQLTRIEHEGRIAHGVDRIIVSTEHEGEQLRKLYGLPACHMRVIPCGVDLSAFTPDSLCEEPLATCDDSSYSADDMRSHLENAHLEARATLSERLGIGDAPLLLFVGRLDPIKGIDLLLESVAEMTTPAQMLVVGGDPQRAGGDPEIERLRGRAGELGIGDRVLFPGAAPQTDLPTYYRAADALVVTSRYESFGLVAVEALACGTPVVAAPVGGLTSVVRDGENGLLTRWRSPSGFAECLDELLTDEALRLRLRAQARPSVERFNWQRIGDRMRTLYGELTGDKYQIATCSCF